MARLEVASPAARRLLLCSEAVFDLLERTDCAGVEETQLNRPRVKDGVASPQWGRCWPENRVRKPTSPRMGSDQVSRSTSSSVTTSALLMLRCYPLRWVPASSTGSGS